MLVDEESDAEHNTKRKKTEKLARWRVTRDNSFR